jgi:hypothetical protein
VTAASLQRSTRSGGPLTAAARSIRRPIDIHNSNQIRPSYRTRRINRNRCSNRVWRRNRICSSNASTLAQSYPNPFTESARLPIVVDVHRHKTSDPASQDDCNSSIWDFILGSPHPAGRNPDNEPVPVHPFELHICIQTLTQFLFTSLHIANTPMLIDHIWASTSTPLVVPSASF